VGTRIRLLALLLATVGGCMPRVDERALEFTEDGVHLYRQGDFKSARECFEVALAMRPDDPNLLFNIGQCHDRQRDDARAEEHYRQCLARLANHAPCRRALATLLCRTGRRAASDQMVQEWLAAEPQLADAYVEDAWRLRQDGDLQAALARLQQARGLDPKNTRAMTEMGLLYESLELPERALQLYEMSLQRDRQQPELTERVNVLKTKGVKPPRPN
jgi:tetratricopeptide (TPR) repeat protein